MRKEIGGKGRKRKGKCVGWGEFWVTSCDVDLNEEYCIYICLWVGLHELNVNLSNAPVLRVVCE